MIEFIIVIALVMVGSVFVNKILFSVKDKEEYERNKYKKI